MDSVTVSLYTYSMKKPTMTEIAQRAYERGFYYEKHYRGCAQCTIAALLDAFELEDDNLFRSSSALSAGGGLTCSGSCGGFIGGLMFIGSLLGRRREFFDNDNDFKYTSFELGKKLHDRFEKEWGSVICKDIHNKIFGKTFDLYNPEEKKQFDEAGAHTTKCTDVVGKASQWTVEIIWDELEKRDLLPKFND